MVENTFASRTMPYTGLIILLFVIIHVFGFGIAAPEDTDQYHRRAVSERLLLQTFLHFRFVALAIHLNHGFWCMLQTFGINHPRYNDLISKLTIIVPLAFLVLFGGIPIYFMTSSGAAY